MAQSEIELLKKKLVFQLGVEGSAEFKSLADTYGRDVVRDAVRTELGDIPEERRKNPDFFERVRESSVLIKGGMSSEEARILTIASLKPDIGADKARFARLRSTQRQRAAQAGASQTVGTTPQGLFDPAHLARRQLTDNPFFRRGGRA